MSTQRWLVLGELKPWRGQWGLPKLVRSGGPEDAANGWHHLVSLEKATAQMADGIRFLSSSNFPCHLSCHIPSTEGNRPSVQNVLMSPWLQLRYNQQWDCQIAIHRTNATHHFNFKQGSGNRHIHPLMALWLLWGITTEMTVEADQTIQSLIYFLAIWSILENVLSTSNRELYKWLKEFSVVFGKVNWLLQNVLMPLAET